jgi:arylformamidase
MSSYLYLSHLLSNRTPLYGGEHRISIDSSKSLRKGDAANTMLLCFPNHAGTHVDAPRHFSDMAETIEDFDPAVWFFKNPIRVSFAAKQNEMIDLIKEVELIPSRTDFLILRTDYQRYRQEEKYWSQNPSLSPASAAMLKTKCPRLRAVGFDFISISGYLRREKGREAHREYLLQHHILVIEDMKLDKLDSSPQCIMAFPLLIEHGDGAPITIIAELR